MNNEALPFSDTMDAPAARDDAASPTPTKKPLASLLPAFEPLSSSPALPRPLKRTRDAFEETRLYPTPVPTSSTHILSSSPPRGSVSRPSTRRNVSTLSERAPFSTIPTIVLNADEKPIRLGRSSASCDFQFSANRLISRVHVEATYRPAVTRLENDKIEVLCTGWNGIKIHCQSKVYDLKKGEIFVSDIRDTEIMLDVHGSRVVLQWPEKVHLGPVSSDEDGEVFSSPTKKQRAMRRHSTPPSPSPLQTRRQIPSPVSPSPAVQALLPSSPPLLPVVEPSRVEIYEDPVGPEDATQQIAAAEDIGSNAQRSLALNADGSQSPIDAVDTSLEFSDNDEENDPIIHSFGAFGANLLPRLAAISAADSPLSSSKKVSRSILSEPLQQIRSPPQPTGQGSEKADIQGHIVNQLAFSRLSSTPLSTILSHLPHGTIMPTRAELQALMKEVKCIGEVMREGKDAAGKPLESEFYYIPDEDDDEMRKGAVVNDLRKPGLRACRKQHKQYFWKKPK